MVATLPLFELALVLMRLDHVASFIVNANHSELVDRLAALNIHGGQSRN